MNTTTTNTTPAARTYSPAVYLAALRHCAGAAAARGAEARREAARNAAAVRLTVSAVLQAAEDAAARRAPVDPEAVRAIASPAPAQAAARPRFDIAAAARRASGDYADLLTLDPSARSLPLWYDCLRRAAAEIRDQSAAGTLRGFFALPGAEQYARLRRAASRVPVWAARSARMMDPEAAAAVLPSARWTLYASGASAASAGAEDDRERVFRSMAPYAWMAPRSMGGDPVEDWETALDEIAAETWTRLRARMDSGKEDPGGAEWLSIYRQTMQAAAAIGRRRHDKPARQRPAAASLDGLRAAAGDAWEIMEVRLMGERVPSPEAETVLRETLRAAAGDDIDLLILRAREYGLTQTEAAAAVPAVRALDALRAGGYDISPAVSAATISAAAARSINHGTVSRRLRAMRDRLDVAPAPVVPWSASHNPGPAPLPAAPAPASRTVRQTPDGWTTPAAPETPAPSRPAAPVPSRLPAPASLPLPAWRTSAPAPAPAQTGTPAPEADPSRETLRAAYAAADRRASASLARLAARREAEARAAAADREARAAAPAQIVPPASPAEARLREVYARSLRRAAARRVR